MEEKVELDENDVYNVKQIVDDIIDVVVKFNGTDGVTQEDFAQLRAVLTFANFVVSGIMYSYGIDPCAGHSHDDEGGVE